MANIFFDGQPGPEIRAKLNDLHGVFEDAVANAQGPQGWAPVLSAEADGARRVLRVTDWTGGQGAKPALLGYVGASGLVLTAALALDVRGAAGGAGPANTLAIGTVTAGAAAATITGTAPAQTLNLQLPAGAAGSAGWTPVFALVSDGARRVQQVSDWTGGSGTKPATGQYVGASGLVGAIASAVDLRGTAGAGAGNVNATGTIATDDLAVFADATGNSIKSAGKKLSGLVLSTDTRLSDARNPTAHSHTIANVTGLQTALDSKGTSNLALGATAATALAGNTPVLPEAPSDGKTYGRKNAAWVEAGGAGSTGSMVITSSQNVPKSTFGSAKFVRVQLWGGGAGGSSRINGTIPAGGEGGEYLEAIIAVADLAATVPVVVGAGGANAVATTGVVYGGAGGNSSFGSYVALGGNDPAAGALNRKIRLVGKTGGDPGAGVGATSQVDTIYGGGGGGLASAAGVPGNPGGTSVFGGAGGEGSGVIVSPNVTAGGNGTAPGGGGGGAYGNIGYTATSGAGARGECRLTWW